MRLPLKNKKILKLDDIPAQDVFVLNGDDSAARSLMLKLANRYHPGALIPVTAEEFVAMKEQMLRLRISQVKT